MMLAGSAGPKHRRWMLPSAAAGACLSVAVILSTWPWLSATSDKSHGVASALAVNTPPAVPQPNEEEVVSALPFVFRHGAVALLTFEKDRIIRRGERFLVQELSPAGNHFSGSGEVPSGEGRVGAGMDLRELQLHLPRTLIGDRPEYTLTAWVFVRQSGEPFFVYAEETAGTEDSSHPPLFAG